MSEHPSEQQAQEQQYQLHQGQQPPLQTVTRPQIPKHAELIASPVRRIVFPSMYGGYQQSQLFTELQKDAAIANELERLTRQIVFLQEDNQRLHSDNTTLVDTLDEREKALYNEQNKLQQRDHNILDLNACLRKKDAEVATLNGRVELLNSKVAGLERTVQDKLTWINRCGMEQKAMNDQLREKDVENGKLRQNDAETTGWCAKLRGDIEVLTSQIVDRDRHNNELAAKVQAYKDAQDELQQVNSQHTKMIDDRNSEITNMNAECAQHIATIDTCNGNIVKLQEDVNNGLALNRTLQAGYDSLKQTFDEKVVECEGLKQEKALLDQRLAALTQEVQGLKADKVGLETTLQTKNATIDDLGINLNNSNLDRQRFAMVASERTAQVNQMANSVANSSLLYANRLNVGYNPGLNYSGINSLVNPLGNTLGASLVNPLLGTSMLPPSPSHYLARSVIGKTLM